MEVVKANTGERPLNQDAWDRGLRFECFIVMVRQGFCLFVFVSDFKKRDLGILIQTCHLNVSNLKMPNAPKWNACHLGIRDVQSVSLISTFF